MEKDYIMMCVLLVSCELDMYEMTIFICDL